MCVSLKRVYNLRGTLMWGYFYVRLRRVSISTKGTFKNEKTPIPHTVVTYYRHVV